MTNAELRIGYLADADNPRSPIALGGGFVETCEHVNNEAQLQYLLETGWLKPEPVETFAGENAPVEEIMAKRADIARTWCA